jgi:hypothetical protein
MNQDECALIRCLENVRDKKTFLAFIAALIRDREASIQEEHRNPSSPYEPEAHGWENTTIERFFEAALAWAADADTMPEEPAWHNFAEFIYSGKIYE